VVKSKALKLVKLSIEQQMLFGWLRFLAPQSRSALGAFYRRLRSPLALRSAQSRLGAPKAFSRHRTQAGTYVLPYVDNGWTICRPWHGLL
jgi:hypothetical protein